MPLDLEQFWRDDELAHQDRCFARAPQVAFGIRMSDECVFAELGEEGNPWDVTPRERRIDLNRRYNDKAERIVGRRLLRETFLPEDAALPPIKRIGDVFGSQYIIENHTEWLTESIPDADTLVQRLDSIDHLDLRAFMLPQNWEAEKKRIFETYGIRPSTIHGIRGPVTLACSLMGTTNFLYFLMDEDELAQRFSKTIANVIIRMAEIMDEEAGLEPDQSRGFSFYDDNCCLLTPDLYESFAYPILREVFERFAPLPTDTRFQHSDSDMEHILPYLGALQLTGVNFGPNVLTPAIRKHLPHATIHGCIAPFSFMRNDRDALTRETLRDIADGFAYGGVNISTAGSINNGSSLESMRFMMELIQNNQRN